MTDNTEILNVLKEIRDQLHIANIIAFGNAARDSDYTADLISKSLAATGLKLLVDPKLKSTD